MYKHIYAWYYDVCMKTKLVLLIVILIIGAGLIWVVIADPFGIGNVTNEEDTLSEQEIETIIENVERHILIESDEEPLVAVIADVDQLVAEQAFYRNAQNGDVLLIFGEAQKAIIYNRENDVLVNVGPVLIDDTVPEVPVETTNDVGTSTEESPVDES